jgi:hypothetical protein
MKLICMPLVVAGLLMGAGALASSETEARPAPAGVATSATAIATPALAAAAPGPSAEEGSSTAIVKTGVPAPDSPAAPVPAVKPQDLFQVGGCDAVVSCPGGATLICFGKPPGNGCLARQTATPPFVACDGVVKSCPSPLM